MSEAPQQERAEEQAVVVEMDCAVTHWKIAEQMAYREKVGVNPQYAAVIIGRAMESGDDEEWTAIDPLWLLGIAWITARRKDSDVDINALAEELDFDDLFNGMLAWVEAQEDVNPTPAPNRAARRKPQRKS